MNRFYFPPPRYNYYYPNYSKINENESSKSLNENEKEKENDNKNERKKENAQVRKSSTLNLYNSVFLEFGGIKLHGDDLLILLLIFFLYKQKIQDNLLLIALFSLLF